ncbi:MAG: hypothetical protein E7633_10275, partial [Ruminococcaceae bacterium]|nr:hypothetical protein [Oscillospiraceae bacterium]
MNIRQILALVLALVMCVLMCACSNDSEDNDESTGTSSKYKKYAKYADLFELLEDEDYAGAIQAIIAMKNESEKEDENQEGNEVNKKFSPVGKYIVTERYDDDFTYNYLTYNEDGSITLGDEETLLVTETSHNENSVNFNIVNNDKYSRILFSREESGLVSCRISSGSSVAYFSRVDQKVSDEIFSEIAGNWVCYDENTKDFLQLELYDDFKVTVNNETYIWTMSHSGEDIIALSAYNSNWAETYRLEIGTSEAGISYVYLIDKIDDNGVKYYYKSKVINALVYSGYYAFDNEVEYGWISIGLNGSFNGIDDMDYWQSVSSDKNSVVGNIYDKKNPDNPAYTFTLKMENGYPQLYLTNITSKTETVYYSYAFGYDTDNNAEYLYQFARKHLAECLKGNNYLPEGYNSFIYGNEYLKYIHGIFSKIKDYKDV